jgi:hypothetical protein
MRKTLALSASFALLALPAQAGDITALLTVTNAGIESPVTVYEVRGLDSRETCLNTAWVASILPPGFNYARSATAQCMEGGRIIAAQTCYKGDCRTIEIPRNP